MTLPTDTNRLVLRLDALFLLLAGGAQLALELAGYFFRLGPYAAIFGGSPYTIGFFEAHGLAVLIALALLADLPRGDAAWHGRMLCVHLLLGGANLLFWPGFAAFGIVPEGIAATALHLIFAGSNGYCLSKAYIQRSISS